MWNLASNVKSRHLNILWFPLGQCPLPAQNKIMSLSLQEHFGNRRIELSEFLHCRWSSPSQETAVSQAFCTMDKVSLSWVFVFLVVSLCNCIGVKMKRKVTQTFHSKSKIVMNAHSFVLIYKTKSTCKKNARHTCATVVFTRAWTMYTNTGAEAFRDSQDSYHKGLWQDCNNNFLFKE